MIKNAPSVHPFSNPMELQSIFKPFPPKECSICTLIDD